MLQRHLLSKRQTKTLPSRFPLSSFLTLLPPSSSPPWVLYSALTIWALACGPARQSTIPPSSVVAAGQTWASASGSDTALNYATIVKLTRTLAIIPICLGLAYLTSKRKATTSEVKISSIFPMFIIYFLGASIINTFAGSHFDFFQFLPAIGKFMIAMAMAAIGLNTNLVKLIKTGGKPILLGLICWFCIAVVSLAMQHLLNIW